MTEILPEDYPYKHLPMGSCAKYAHRGCSGSKAMKVNIAVDGAMFHCFKCGATRFIKHFDMTYRSRKIREAELAKVQYEKSRRGYGLPADFSHDIAPAGLAWLGSGGWTSDLIERYGIGWSNNMKRVVIPVEPEGYTARAVFKDQVPKYLEKAPAQAFWISSTIVNTLAITEDILSAGRVGEFIPTESVLGTSVGNWMPPTEVTKVILWLDNDAAGRKGRAAFRKKLQWFPDITIQDIETSKDPKCYSRDEIKEILCQT